MPSWAVHTAVAADVFGIDAELADRINQLVDGEDVHDLGRRWIREPRLIESIYDREADERYIAYEGEVWRKVSRVLADKSSATAFWLHHALDLLAPRLVAAELTKLPAERYYDNMFVAIKRELEPVPWNIIGGRRSLEEFLPLFEAKLGDVAKHPELGEWVKQVASLRKEEARVSVDDLLFPATRKRASRATELERGEAVKISTSSPRGISIVVKISTSLPEGIAALSWAARKASRSARKRYMDLMYRVSCLAARRSLLIDYALLTPYPWEFLRELILRITKKRAAKLGREALRACEHLEGEARREAIVEAVHRFERWLAPYNISVPEECAETYADVFTAGYELVHNLVSNSQPAED